MSAVFSFKEFQVDQTDCAMKINTDGVLLAVLASSESPLRILDIGTGTGVIALMLAQRYAAAQVDAVEIDAQAGLRAEYNFRHSPFAERLHLVGQDFHTFVAAAPYDLIVANPPFYTDSLPNPDERKRLAKHADRSFFEKLLTFVAQNLAPKGSFQLIIPPMLGDVLREELLPQLGMHIVEEVAITSFAETPVIRVILRIAKDAAARKSSSFYIYASKGVHSEAYKAYLKPFFLAY